jgi:hypothetical protein
MMWGYRSFSGKCSMSDPMPTNLYARRWHALLAENTAIQNEHLELISSFTPPFSSQQEARLEASAARLQKLGIKLHELVDDWSTDASGDASLPRGFPFPQSPATRQE